MNEIWNGLPEWMLETGRIITYLKEHLNCQSIKGHRLSGGNWDTCGWVNDSQHFHSSPSSVLVNSTRAPNLLNFLHMSTLDKFDFVFVLILSTIRIRQKVLQWALLEHFTLKASNINARVSIWLEILRRCVAGENRINSSCP